MQQEKGELKSKEVNDQETLAQLILYSNGLYFNSWVMEHDDRACTPHTWRQTREILSENQVQVLQSPDNSLDQSSMENVWEIFKHNVEKKKTWTICVESRELLSTKTRKKLVQNQENSVE